VKGIGEFTKKLTFLCEFQHAPEGLRLIRKRYCEWETSMKKLENLGDKGLIALYESLRRQTLAANGAGRRSRVVGPNTKDYAERLWAEIERRRLPITPIK